MTLEQWKNTMSRPAFSIDFEQTLSRRRLIRGGMLNAAGMLLASRLLADEKTAGKEETAPGVLPDAKANAVIQIWLAGGPPHIDTFDPKPDAGVEYTGPLSSKNSTNIPGFDVGELLPELATVADKYLADSQFHARPERPRDRFVPHADRPHAGPDSLSGRRRGCERVQGSRRRVGV